MSMRGRGGRGSVCVEHVIMGTGEGVRAVPLTGLLLLSEGLLAWQLECSGHDKAPSWTPQGKCSKK